MVISVTLVSRVGSKTRSEVAFEIELLNFNFNTIFGESIKKNK